MPKSVRFDLGQRRHNGQFVGWAVWKVHPGCMKSPQECCPKTVAEFYGKHANRYAMAHVKLLNEKAESK